MEKQISCGLVSRLRHRTQNSIDEALNARFHSLHWLYSPSNQTYFQFTIDKWRTNFFILAHRQFDFICHRPQFRIGTIRHKIVWLNIYSTFDPNNKMNLFAISLQFQDHIACIGLLQCSILTHRKLTQSLICWLAAFSMPILTLTLSFYRSIAATALPIRSRSRAIYVVRCSYYSMRNAHQQYIL